MRISVTLSPTLSPTLNRLRFVDSLSRIAHAHVLGTKSAKSISAISPKKPVEIRKSEIPALRRQGTAALQHGGRRDASAPGTLPRGVAAFFFVPLTACGLIAKKQAPQARRRCARQSSRQSLRQSFGCGYAAPNFCGESPAITRGPRSRRDRASAAWGRRVRGG